MNYFNGVFIPDDDARIEVELQEMSNNSTSLRFSAYPVSIALHLTHEQMIAVRDKIAEFLDSPNAVVAQRSERPDSSREVAEGDIPSVQVPAHRSNFQPPDDYLSREAAAVAELESDESYEATAALLAARQGATV